MKMLRLGLLGIAVAGFGCSDPGAGGGVAPVVLAELPAAEALARGQAQPAEDRHRGPIRDRRFDWR